MKILHLGKYYYPHMGGIENHLQLLATESAKKNNDVTVVVSNDTYKFEKETISKVDVYRYPKLMELFNAPISPQQILFPTDDYDVLHVHLPNPIASIQALLSDNKNIVVTYHSDILKFNVFAKLLNFIYTKLFLHPLLKRAKKILITSPNYLEDSGILKKYRRKIKVVPYSIDLAKFRLDSQNRKTLEKLKTKYKKSKVILFVGRLIPYKGLKYLIAAMPNIIKEINGVRLLIVGDGPLKEELQNLANKLGISNHIDFLHGMHNTKLPPFYYLCDVFVLPSIYKSEAFGIVQLEAMACGKPVVSTKVFGSGISFVNKNNETGFVVGPYNSDVLSNVIIKLLKNGALSRQFGNNATHRVEKFFSKDIMVKSILDIYKFILMHQKES